MIKAAERLFRAPEADKPTVLLMINRNELEDLMLKNFAALDLGNLEHASSIARLNRLLKDDYRGIIVTMIHKFRDMPAGGRAPIRVHDDGGEQLMVVLDALLGVLLTAVLAAHSR
jgi:type I site-specific restriction-modification system R (restriction) subunit